MSDKDKNPPADPQAPADPAAGSSRPPGPAAGADGTTGSDPLAEVTRQRDDYLDQLQRSRAEFANYQKRARAQAEADRAYAVGPLAADLLHVIDNFERALEAARAAGASPIVEGLEMVHRQLLETLAKHGVEPIEARGLPFDPSLHEAIAQRPDPQHAQGTVVDEFGRGYRLRDRVLRPSRVVVSAGAGEG